MASPTVQTRAESAVTTTGTTHAVTMPASIAAGDLLFAFLAFSAAQTATWPGDWTPLTSGSQARHIGYKIAAGGDSLSITSGAGVKSSHLTWRIAGHADPGTQAPEFNSATATSATPDPPSISPTGGSKDYLILAMFRQAGEEADDDTWCNSAPANYTNLIQITSGVGGTPATNCSAAGAERQVTTATEDPGTFSVDQSLVYHALTVAIHPASTGDATATPATVAAVASVPSPTAQGAAQTAPTTVAAVGAVPAPTARGAAQTAPATVAAVGAVPAPTARGAGVASPSTVAGVGAVPAATASGAGDATANPATVAGIGAIPAPTARGAAVTSPATVAGAGAAPAPTARGAGVTSPATVAAIGAVPAPSASGTAGGNAQANPGTVAAIAAVPAATAQGAGRAIPNTVAAIGAVPAPSASGGGPIPDIEEPTIAVRVFNPLTVAVRQFDPVTMAVTSQDERTIAVQVFDPATTAVTSQDERTIGVKQGDERTIAIKS